MSMQEMVANAAAKHGLHAVPTPTDDGFDIEVYAPVGRFKLSVIQFATARYPENLLSQHFVEFQRRHPSCTAAPISPAA